VRQHLPADLNRIADPQAKYHTDIWVGDNGNFTPVAQVTGGVDPTLEWTIRKNIANLAEDVTLTCTLGKGSSCLSPYMSGGAKTISPDGARPALAEGRELMIRLGVSGPGADPGEMRAVFRGVIDDTNAGGDKDEVVSQGRDIIGAVLMDSQISMITQVTENGVTSSKWGFPVPANGLNEVLNIIQTLTWNHNWTVAGLNPNQHPFPGGGIYFPGPQATLVLNDFWQDRVANLGEALRVQALKAVYDLRGRWEVNGIRDDFVCACYRPDRLGSSSPVFAFHNPKTAPPGFLRWRRVQRLSRPLSNVRNVWEGTPFNPDDPSVRVPQQVVDQASVKRYGRVGFRFAYLSEDRSTGIDTTGKWPTP
jgi:hypothetical protein